MNIGGHVSHHGLTITKLLMHETGSYNPQYRRPYDTHMEASTLDTIFERLGNSQKYDASLMGGLASKFIAPTATPEKQLTLANGWNQRRMRFMMEVEYQYITGGKMTEVILGYSDFNGVSGLGNIAPEMKFYINSIMDVRNTMHAGPMGNQNVSMVTGCSHLLVNNDWTSIYDQNRDQHMRPTDVYVAMSRSQLHGLPMNGVTDARSMANNNAVKSFRSNASAPEYMSRILNGYSQAALAAPYGQDEKSIIDTARGINPEASASSDPFLSMLMQVRNDTCIGNVFTFNDLLRMDPGVESRTQALLLSPETMSTTHQAGQTSDWGGSDISTSTATILSQTIPGILMDLALTRVVFKTTNRDFASVIRTVIIDAQGFSNGDLSKQLAIFINRIETEVLRDISFNNAIEFAIGMSVDLLGETWLNLSLDGKASIDYVTPSFCDALMTPVISSNNQQVMNLASDFQIVAEHLVDRHPLTQGHSTSTNFSGLGSAPSSGYRQGII